MTQIFVGRQPRVVNGQLIRGRIARLQARQICPSARRLYCAINTSESG